MARIILNSKKLKHNYQFLDKLFKSKEIHWGVVTKVLCGNELYLKEVLSLGVSEVHDSRVSNLAMVKSLSPKVQTVYIKPPAELNIPEVVQYADVSFNTEFHTIEKLSAEAKKQGKTHKIIIMIEMGDLREGIMGDHLMDFYAKIIDLPNIEISGIGANLSCLLGVLPTQDKLIQISLYKQLLEYKFNIKIPFVSGGTTVTVPLLLKNMNPMAVNHFRVGEALFFGNNMFTNETIEGMNDDVLTCEAQIIEITEKPNVPIGYLGENVDGNQLELGQVNDYGESSLRALLDFGLLDVKADQLKTVDESLEVIEASSDITVINLGKNKSNYKVGDWIKFEINYMAALMLLNSSYIEKKLA